MPHPTHGHEVLLLGCTCHVLIASEPGVPALDDFRQVRLPHGSSAIAFLRLAHRQQHVFVVFFNLGFLVGTGRRLRSTVRTELHVRDINRKKPEPVDIAPIWKRSGAREFLRFTTMTYQADAWHLLDTSKIKFGRERVRRFDRFGRRKLGRESVVGAIVEYRVEERLIIEPVNRFGHVGAGTTAEIVEDIGIQSSEPATRRRLVQRRAPIKSDVGDPRYAAM